DLAACVPCEGLLHDPASGLGLRPGPVAPDSLSDWTAGRTVSPNGCEGPPSSVPTTSITAAAVDFGLATLLARAAGLDGRCDGPVPALVAIGRCGGVTATCTAHEADGHSRRHLGCPPLGHAQSAGAGTLQSAPTLG